MKQKDLATSMLAERGFAPVLISVVLALVAAAASAYYLSLFNSSAM